MLCSVTCTGFCDMLFHICGVMLCCIYYVTYVILCYICNVMVHALYEDDPIMIETFWIIPM